MAGYFMQNGETFTMTDKMKTVIHEKLPVGIYQAEFHPMRGFYLTQKEDARRALPPKLYGTVLARADRVLTTFKERAAQNLQTGVLLSGEKGSGKTLLGRLLMEACKLPVVLVGQPFCGPEFSELLAAGGSKMVFLDEFEKVYKDQNHQNALLSMLDGTYDVCNLVVATLNDSNAVVDAMKNRPSRFYYHYRYSGLDKAFVTEYATDRLLHTEGNRLAEIQAITSRIAGFNFDMLQALVEEMNRFNDTPDNCLRHLNIIPARMTFQYTVRLTDTEGKDIPIKDNQLVLGTWRPEDMHFGVVKQSDPANPMEYEDYYFDGDNYIATADGAHVFRNDGRVAVVKPKHDGPREWAI